MTYPSGSKFNRWVIVVDKKRDGSKILTVRRWVIFPDESKKLERLSINKYKSIQNDLPALKEFVVRLNAQVPKEIRTKQVVEIRHAFISPKLLDDYKDYLLVQIPTRSDALNEFHYLKTYFLGFFINTLNIPDPLVWHKLHETEWASYLLSKDCPPSVSTKKDIISAANRFMGWLHKRRPEEVPPLKFEPISKARFKEVEAKRVMNGEARETKMINDTDWALIEGMAPENLKPFILLEYLFGLRRSESMGLNPKDVRKGYLSVERQLTSFTDSTPKYGPLKGREKRRIPYWFCKIEEAYELIKESHKYLMHPDTLTDLFTEYMATLGLDYTLHDMRHTWITKSMRKQNPRDVQLAAGHKNITTTMGYLHDDRELEEQHFVPEGA